MIQGLKSPEIDFVRQAANYLERPSFAMRVTQLLGKPIEKGLEMLPEAARQHIALGSHRALQGCLKAALFTLQPDSEPGAPPEVRDAERDAEEIARKTSRAKLRHGFATAVTGALGGALGLPGIALELPISTTLIFRGIASIARSNGIDLSQPRNQLECLSLFAFGVPVPGASSEGSAPSGTGYVPGHGFGAAGQEPGLAESSYFAQRIIAAQLVSEAMAFVGRATAEEVAEAMARQSGPALVRLISKLASRFEIVVSQKAMAQLLPVIGAGSGAIINTAFTDHYSTVAGYHFGLRRLERRHGEEAVRAVYRDSRA